MGPITVILIAIGAVALFACILQIFILSRKGIDTRYISGAILSLLVFFYLVMVSLGALNTGQSGNLYSNLKIQLVLLQLVFISFISLGYLIANEKNRLILYSGIAVLACITIVSIALPYLLLFGEKSVTNIIVFPSGEELLMFSPGFTWWRMIINFSVLICFIFYLILIFRNINSLELNLITYLAIGLGLMLIAALFDQMIDLGSVHSYYLLPFGIFLDYCILTFILFNFLIKDVLQRHETIDQEKEWRTLVNQASVMVVGLNRMGHVDFVNPYFLQLTGYREKEVIGKDWFAFFVPSDQSYEVQSAFIEILEYDFHAHYQNNILTRYQEHRLIDWYNVRLRNASGQITGSMSIGIDISERSLESDQLKQKLHEAEELIKSLKAKLKNSEGKMELP